MRRLVVLVVVLVATALASTAGTAKAGLITGLLGGGCGATAPVFAPWGDWATYYFAPNGGVESGSPRWAVKRGGGGAAYYFAPNGGVESGSTGWTISGGAAVVAQNNEPWFLAGFGSHALELP